MAEVLGLIAAVVQVADLGVKLSKNIYQYCDTVSSADKRLPQLAAEVGGTTVALKELQEVFQKILSQHSNARLSVEARDEADKTFAECKSVFKELDNAITKSMTKLGRWKLPFCEAKIEVLGNHIEKLKSNLLLLAHVIQLKQQQADHDLNREAEAELRNLIMKLVDDKEDSIKRYLKALEDYDKRKGRRSSDDEDDEDDREIEGQDAFGTSSVTTPTPSTSSTIKTNDLDVCVQQLRHLLRDIQDVQQALSSQPSYPYDRRGLVSSYVGVRDRLDKILLGGSQPALTIKNDGGFTSYTFSVPTQGSTISYSETSSENIRTKLKEERIAWQEVASGRDTDELQERQKLEVLPGPRIRREREYEEVKREYAEKQAATKRKNESQHDEVTAELLRIEQELERLDREERGGDERVDDLLRKWTIEF